MPATTSTALPSFSHDQHHETDAAKQKGGCFGANMYSVISLNKWKTGRLLTECLVHSISWLDDL